MKTSRGNRGFTLVETLGAVAILIILGGLIFVNVIAYQRTLRQLEYDATAKEIFVAAQNHLTMANGQGLIEPLDNATVTEVGYPEGAKDIYYVVYPDATSPAILDHMLPFASIDETVRHGAGSYVIRYQKSTALVLDVFYSGECEFSTDKDAYTTLMGFAGEDKKAARLDDYTSPANEKAIIGWYGGEEGDPQANNGIKAPEIVVVNAEQLRVEVTDKNYSGNAPHAQLRVVITGKTSGAQRYFTLISAGNGEGEYIRNTLYAIGPSPSDKYVIVLDSITEQNSHFADVFQNNAPANNGNGTEFIPGEDLYIEGIAFDNSKISNVARSGRKTTNSLYASTLGTNDVARVANIRHIENLDKSISSMDKNDTQHKLNIVAAEQVASIAWTDDYRPSTSDDKLFYQGLKGFREQVLSSRNLKSGGAYATSIGSTDAIKIFDKNQSEYTNTYVSVNAEYLESYDGKRHSISNVVINASSDAGLFKELQKTGAAVVAKDVELRSFSINTSTGKAGALAGSATNATISGVLVRNTVKNDSSVEITGTGSVGGLVGSVSGGSITQSAAAVYVKSTAGAAGGLVGEASSTTITQSYSGGHTSGGAYVEATSSTAQEPTRYNVQAQLEVGGLVGKASDSTVQQSYSTCSVYGLADTSTVGGIVGSLTGGSVKNSYTTGLVASSATDKKATTPTVGTFVGINSGGAFEANHYYSLVNMYETKANETVGKKVGDQRSIPVVGGAAADASISGITALDADTAIYNTFVVGTDASIPYDTYLKQKSNGKYPLKNIKTLAGITDATALPKLVTTHYGDWPMPEVMLLNTKSAS